MQSRKILIVGPESRATAAIRLASPDIAFTQTDKATDYTSMVSALYQGEADGIIHATKTDTDLRNYDHHGYFMSGLAAVHAAYAVPLVRNVVLLHPPSAAHLETYVDEIIDEHGADEYAPHFTSIRLRDALGEHAGVGLNATNIGALGHAILTLEQTNQNLPSHVVMAQASSPNPYNWEPGQPDPWAS